MLAAHSPLGSSTQAGPSTSSTAHVAGCSMCDWKTSWCWLQAALGPLVLENLADFQSLPGLMLTLPLSLSEVGDQRLVYWMMLGRSQGLMVLATSLTPCNAGESGLEPMSQPLPCWRESSTWSRRRAMMEWSVSSPWWRWTLLTPSLTLTKQGRGRLRWWKSRRN